ncbi:hypothetical protein TVAGG3_0150160 [Trichomonas vaginalis G3]|uniref:hypothetical protein n=1 Tax=Trichomonas vaginalis (strain ATCC PRA-98 / G3) TaxID=412133 RepID=UPI0021E533D7|nr:hypothetical protein TVAGG3_0150160 [Trichomonas vaginalis G3]KAI5547215.1 hypothetical protein TVAGG3_0150160 [Trichomonas vaginalis G3]
MKHLHHGSYHKTITSSHGHRHRCTTNTNTNQHNNNPTTSSKHCHTTNSSITPAIILSYSLKHTTEQRYIKIVRKKP